MQTKYFGNKPDGQEAKDDGIVRLVVVVWNADVRTLPQLTFPLVQLPRR